MNAPTSWSAGPPPSVPSGEHVALDDSWASAARSSVLHRRPFARCATTFESGAAAPYSKTLARIHQAPPISARLWSACAAAPLSLTCPTSHIGKLGNPKTSPEPANRHHAPPTKTSAPPSHVRKRGGGPARHDAGAFLRTISGLKLAPFTLAGVSGWTPSDRPCI